MAEVSDHETSRSGAALAPDAVARKQPATRIALFANTAWYLFRFVLPYAKFLQQHGMEVIFLSPEGRHVDRLRKAGFDWRPVPLRRLGANPIGEVGTIRAIRRVYQDLRPDLVNHFTSKPVIYGSLAARGLATCVVNTIPGMGYLFVDTSWWSGAAREVVLQAYRLAFRLPHARVLVQNPEDLALLRAHRCAHPDSIREIAGSGVDVDRFPFSTEPMGVPIVLMASRLLRQKGVFEFVEAARALSPSEPRARFVLAGEPDPGNPGSVPAGVLRAWQKAGTIEWWGWREDMEVVLASSHVIVLPSYGGEGVPSVLLEGASVGRPLVATDVPGSREVVRPGETGFLVPPRDGPALAAAIARCLADPGLRARMGQAARDLVQRRFTRQLVNESTFAVYQELIPADASSAHASGLPQEHGTGLPRDAD